VDASTSSSLTRVWGREDNNIFVVGTEGTILHYNGAVWQVMDSGTAQTLEGIWGTLDGSVFTVGVQGTILYYNGGVVPARRTSWGVLKQLFHRE
jgi:photosystem II stability/assembly factor-like uncharacterized protein